MEITIFKPEEGTDKVEKAQEVSGQFIFILF